MPLHTHSAQGDDGGARGPHQDDITSITTGVMWAHTASIRTTYATMDSSPAPIASHGKLARTKRRVQRGQR